jgi:uncharacterized membrane protein YkvA (DUF1232 family)
MKTLSMPYWRFARGKNGMFQKWRERARALKAEIYALIIAYRDPRTPWVAKACALAVVAYALSPIDLIPDFIPVLGYLDDLVLLPLGIALAVKLIPAGVIADARLTATKVEGGAIGKAGALVIALVWLALLGLAIGWGIRFFQKA